MQLCEVEMIQVIGMIVQFGGWEINKYEKWEINDVMWWGWDYKMIKFKEFKELKEFMTRDIFNERNDWRKLDTEIFLNYYVNSNIIAVVQ